MTLHIPVLLLALSLSMGFTPLIPPVHPSSSDSSVETPVDGRRKCSSCPRKMSKKSAVRHTVCITCRGFDCDINNRCEECLELSEDDIVAYAKYCKSLKSRESSSANQKSKIPLTPLTPSRPSPQPAPLPRSNPLRDPRNPLRVPPSAMTYSPRWTLFIVILHLCQTV